MIYVYNAVEVKPLFYDTDTAAKQLCLYEIEMTRHSAAAARRRRGCGGGTSDGEAGRGVYLMKGRRRQWLW